MTLLLWRRGAALLVVCLSFFVSVSARPTPPPVYFEEFLSKRFSGASEKTWDAQAFCPTASSIVARRVLESYGSMFSASDTVILPAVCVHDGEAPVAAFQKRLSIDRVEMSSPISLQKAAATALRAALDEVKSMEMRMSPLDGSIAGARSYGDTLMLWNSRVFPALNYWSRRGRLTGDEVYHLAGLDPSEKVRKILEWEDSGIYFGTNRSRSILSSTAPPGASQHIALIALDIVEYSNPEVRAIMNRHGWYQTILDDAPHFTFLGYPETELPGRGLKQVYKGGHAYWIPNLTPKPN